MAALLEGTSALLILAARPFLVDPIRRRAAIYAEQSAAIRRFLRGDRGQWVFDSLLGWTTVQARRLGGRAAYPPRPAPGVVRVAGFGNSFMRGAEVAAEDSWMSQLERADTSGRLEVLNFGVAAFGTDQSLLQYRRDGRGMAPAIVLIGLAPDNLRRNVNVYRRFLSTVGPPLTKPRFLLGPEGGLALLPNPLRRPEDLQPYLDDPSAVRAWGAHDAWYEALIFERGWTDWSATARLATGLWIRLRRRFFDPDPLFRGDRVNTDGSGYRLTVALLRRFAAEVRGDGAVPVIVLMPDRLSLTQRRDGRDQLLAPVLVALAAEGIPCLDLGDPLLEAGPDPDGLLMSNLHYSPEASARIARWLAPRLLGLAERPAAGRTGERP